MLRRRILMSDWLEAGYSSTLSTEHAEFNPRNTAEETQSGS